MGRKSPRLRRLATELAQRFPHLEDPDALIAAGEVCVDGFPRTNPASLVSEGVSLTLRSPKQLRGKAKLAHALSAFHVHAGGRIAVDLGAAAGGFTQALLDAGAARVYAVDVGHGQLLGSLRQDERVVNLERTNLAQLDTALIRDPVELISIDLSYLAIAAAAPQLEMLRIDPQADLIALVKPIYELGLQALPTDDRQLHAAVDHAADGLAASGWSVAATCRSPVLGARGAIEWLLHAARRSPRCT
jgi:23S rRNA (cytidine1920-2'-O)/16S rRNA (cytidine1409-2'-O)-methyltransferase